MRRKPRKQRFPGELGYFNSNLEHYKKMKQLRYMERHIGDAFDGVVSGVLRSGFFVEIEAVFAEGYISSADLNQPVDFDSENQRLILRHTRKAIGLGMSVRVVVCAVDLNALEMDLTLAEDANPFLLKRRHGGKSLGRKKRIKKGKLKKIKKR